MKKKWKPFRLKRVRGESKIAHGSSWDWDALEAAVSSWDAAMAEGTGREFGFRLARDGVQD